MHERRHADDLGHVAEPASGRRECGFCRWQRAADQESNRRADLGVTNLESRRRNDSRRLLKRMEARRESKVARAGGAVPCDRWLWARWTFERHWPDHEESHGFHRSRRRLRAGYVFPRYSKWQPAEKHLRLNL